MPEHTHRVPEQPGPSGRPTIPPLEELERLTEARLAGQSAAGTQAGPSVPTPRRQAQLAAETIQTLRENVSMLSEVSERAVSVASSSHRRSHQAMQLLETRATDAGDGTPEVRCRDFIIEICIEGTNRCIARGGFFNATGQRKNFGHPGRNRESGRKSCATHDSCCMDRLGRHIHRR